MVEIVESKLEQLRELCVERHVHNLYLFGSATRATFNEKTSDLDFAVEFSKSVDPIDFADHYFSFLSGLKELFKRDVDLLSYTSLKNEVIIRQVEETKVQLYAA